MFLMTSVGLNTIIRNQDLTVIVARRPRRKGMFAYEIMADMLAVDELLRDELGTDDLTALKRLFSGYCPKREAYQYASKMSDMPKELVAVLEALGVLKEKPVVQDNVLAEYALRDGYTLKLENLDDGLYITEYQGKEMEAKTKVLSVREGRSRIKMCVSNIENLERVSFQIIKSA
jgi:hypothetical protein